MRKMTRTPPQLDLPLPDARLEPRFDAPPPHAAPNPHPTRPGLQAQRVCEPPQTQQGGREQLARGVGSGTAPRPRTKAAAPDAARLDPVRPLQVQPIGRPGLPAIIPPAARPGPGPSKLAYRLTRAWAKPAVRQGVLVYLPLALLGLVGWRLVANDWVRARGVEAVAAVYDLAAERPEFALQGVAVTGGNPDLRAQAERAAEVPPGVSSLKLDVDAVRARIEAIGAVRSASVQIDPQGVLQIRLVERVAAALTRDDQAQLVVLDATGVPIGQAATRVARPDLPLVLGAGATKAVAEAIALNSSQPDLAPRVRAYVRVGERRWDVVLDHDVTIQLPETGAAEALARVMALQYGDELLDRDLATIDMRVPSRPTLRMSPRAAETYQLRRSVGQEGKDT